MEKQLETCSGASFTQFLELIKIDCKFELDEFGANYDKLTELQYQLADYFCENRNTFQLDECLKIFNFLMNRLQQTLKEHVTRETRKLKKEEKKETQTTRECEKTMKKPEKIDLFDALTASNGGPES